MHKHSQAHNLLSSYIYTPQVYAAYWSIPCKAHRFSAMIRKVLSKLSIEIANLGRFNRSKQTTRFVAVIKLLTAQVSDVLIILMLRFIQIKTSNRQFPRGGN
ncbi:MAG TPA: hypothetical protein PKW91_03640 [Rectinema sp.]|jgi:hypothetical protein|nr:hypothetical protein [Rectinema sp.]